MTGDARGGGASTAGSSDSEASSPDPHQQMAVCARLGNLGQATVGRPDAAGRGGFGEGAGIERDTVGTRASDETLGLSFVTEARLARARFVVRPAKVKYEEASRALLCERRHSQFHAQGPGLAQRGGARYVRGPIGKGCFSDSGGENAQEHCICEAC